MSTSRALDRVKPVLLAAALLAGALAGGVVASADVRKLVLNVVGWFGGSYRLAYQARTPDQGGARRSEYLVVLNDGARAVDYLAFFSASPQIEYLSESVYPNTIRISLPVPVSGALEKINSQSFTRFVFRNLAIFFCH
jgi:hypothetical protein